MLMIDRWINLWYDISVKKQKSRFFGTSGMDDADGVRIQEQKRQDLVWKR